MFRWHIITGEYPPQPGGVSDYTRLVACGLAKAGDDVEVSAPECWKSELQDAGVRIRRLPGHFGPRALSILGRAIGDTNPCRLLVQYVPHAFGFKAMNLAFCGWLFAHRHLDITVFFHEVAFPRRTMQPLRYNLLGEVTTAMAKLAAKSATRIFVASASWEHRLRPMVPGNRLITSLPVPSNVPFINEPEPSRAIRARYTPSDGLLAGHFGTYGKAIREDLEVLLPEVLSDRRVSIILLGRGSSNFRAALALKHPSVVERLHAVGWLSAEDLSLHLSACDLMIQPYPGGINTRRTSAMAALSHGCPIVTTRGDLTEPMWIESHAVATTPAEDLAMLAPLAISLLNNPLERQRLSLAGAKLYEKRCDLRHTIERLRATDADCDSRVVQP